ncbi:transmembrane protein 179B [Osmerus eperlanus]|uniref:transmembrane protein 179B n=1 Tax=Osmerus eperlanus TaxID=29151 RepID=UPI002E1587BA
MVMSLPWLLLVELGLYATCFVCGIVTAASLTITQGNLGGLCVLYGSVSYNASSGWLAPQSSSPASLCYFLSSVSVLAAIVCFSLSLYWLYTCCLEEHLHRERVWMSVTLGVCVLFLFFLLVSGCVLKIGRDTLCDSVTHTVPNITSCEEAQTRTWTSPNNGAQFYTSLLKAETAVWVNFFSWVVIGVLLLLQRGRGSKFTLLGEGPDVSASETEPFLHRPARP